MYTTCARCETQLTVTVAGLRSGQGFVRCSRCGDVFNALPQLSEEGDGTDIANATGSRPALKSPPDAHEPWPVEETAESEHVTTGTFQTIVLEGDAVMETEEVVPETELDAQIKEIAGQIEANQEEEDAEHPTFDLDEGELDRHELEHAVTPEDRAPVPTPAPAPATGEQTTAAPPLTAEPSTPMSDPAALLGRPAEPAARRRWPWVTGALLLVLLVAATVVHRFRQDLLERSWAAQPLTAGYRLLHLRLEQRWDVTAYEVRQLGAEAGQAADGATPTRITVRASIHNHAARPQPAPLLRVTLQDRFGQQLTTRVVAPEEYLHDTPPGLLGADQRRDVTFTVPDPGQGAVGFEIDACLRDAGGALRCSSDPPVH